jgi:hypothetical protein
MTWFSSGRIIMKKLLLFGTVLTLIGVNAVFGDQTIDAATWKSVEKFDPVVLSKTLGDHVGKIIAIEFNFRGKGIHHLKPRWYEGSLWQPDPKARKGFSAVRVMLARKDLNAFQTITSDSASPARLTVYGRVEHDAHNNFYYVHLFGRKATVDSAGNTTIVW